MSSCASKGTLAQRLGLERLILGPPISGNVPRLWGRSFDETHHMIDRTSFTELVWDCPACGVPSKLDQITSTIRDDYDGRSTDLAPHPSFTFAICRCTIANCGEIVFVKYDKEKQRIADAFPSPNSQPSTFASSIPEKVKEDLAEGMRCFYANSYKACVAMCRRALQNMAKQYVEARDIADQIKELRSKGFITEALFNAAQEIRQFGAYGAHPQNDMLDEVTPEIATSIIELVNQFTEQFYVTPAKTKELAKLRQAAKQKESAK
jgi:Domain of unknown function (DUF4145)